MLMPLKHKIVIVVIFTIRYVILYDINSYQLSKIAHSTFPENEIELHYDVNITISSHYEINIAYVGEIGISFNT